MPKDNTSSHSARATMTFEEAMVDANTQPPSVKEAIEQVKRMLREYAIHYADYRAQPGFEGREENFFKLDEVDAAIDNLAALAAQAVEAEPIGEVVIGERDTAGWTVIKWRADATPIAVGTKLYTAPQPSEPSVNAELLGEELREFLGKLVRAEWIAWAKEQPIQKPSWLQPWSALTEPEREVDRRIGEKLWSFAACRQSTSQPAEAKTGETAMMNKALEIIGAGWMALPAAYRQQGMDADTEAETHPLPLAVAALVCDMALAASPSPEPTKLLEKLHAAQARKDQEATASIAKRANAETPDEDTSKALGGGDA